MGRRKSDRTRESLLDAARIAFARKGFSGVTVRDITDLSRINRASFYYYFTDKTELFIELGTATYREALHVVESFGDLDHSPTQSAIRGWVNDYFSYLDRNGAFVIRSADDAPRDRKFRAAVTRAHGRTALALGERIAKLSAQPPEAEPIALGLSVMAMLDRTWLMVQHNAIPSASRESVVLALSEMILRLLT
ncbi:TetR/AcrR family transcriptional regulator [Mycobacterium arosiense]|uniref:TetR family transcriptional regulator n=1 Tax=Mycobacterium arosiense ATCC BAA-1401 = DSM 45069 TaxID=1265311 RepID=A0A1W9ZQ54_MYCAI|nr:TetR/AcrR family transcriptional regulator [Mycobacterium arosiense]ORA19920.1 TetR family transcriptional regulator [Mycobacterium arosiense ATCC BAA-1401 = DSM 45069]